MPVGTRASVKTMPQDELENIDSRLILANTYHLYLRPGHQLIAAQGGLHAFTSWPHAILTDSGGFQIYSLSSLRKITEEGVRFRSHIDGAQHFLTPEGVMEIQRALGADIVMAFDECPALPSTRAAMEESVALTGRWARRCLSVPLQEHQHFFAIVQGGLELDLRLRSLEEHLELEQKMRQPISGLAIGGLAVGERAEEREELCINLLPHFPSDRPRYLMGVGRPWDILMAIKSGVDMFDCVLPCRNARNGQALTSMGPVNIKNAIYATDQGKLDPDCSCKVCQRYTRAYLRHLMMSGEYLGGQLLTHHNLSFYREITRKARQAIFADQFDEFLNKFYKSYFR
ncbi:MAG: tRNA guanosine(34) transglycosylase Tgt, partial [Oligoflexia bacterium]|nr:tRNA guanosine(34) transglycosylase Tgt [Oligoflexia bacterium]